MMLDRDTDGIVAVLTSLRAFGANVPAMIVWGSIIVALTAAGFALFFVGLVVTVPVIGHATWHAYRALVERGMRSRAAIGGRAVDGASADPLVST